MPNQPQALKSGDKVAIFCPASTLDRQVIVDAAKELENWGLKVEIGDTVGAQYNRFAGTDEQRIEEFQRFLDDDEIEAIFCARGGYGSARIIDHISFENFIEQPKWIIGFSDVTTIHNHINQIFGIETIHSVMPSGFADSLTESVTTLKHTLFGNKFRYQFPAHALNKTGIGEGLLVGGNLAIVHSMLGSKSQLNTDGKILFLEDVGEKLYNIDRMMVSLKRAGQLSNLSGLLAGGFTGTKGEEFGKTAQEIILEHAGIFNYPIAFDFPAGHQKDNRALIFNHKVKLEVGQPCFLDFR